MMRETEDTLDMQYDSQYSLILPHANYLIIANYTNETKH